jgi:hypothetical protein
VGRAVDREGDDEVTWVYEQATGKLFDKAGQLAGEGYSGGNCGKNPEGKNNPALESTPDVGPLPCGFYFIGPPENTVTHGPYVLPLDPVPSNEMFLRSEFKIHGDSTISPGQGVASEGCIIMDRLVREKIWASQDRWLQVIARKSPS